MDMPNPESVLGKRYTIETARLMPHGGLVNSDGIIIQVITEEQAKAQFNACKEHLKDLLADTD